MRYKDEEIEIVKDGAKATCIRSAYEKVWKHKGWSELGKEEQPKKKTAVKKTEAEELVLDVEVLD